MEREIPIADISVSYNPRRTFSQPELVQLSESMLKVGLIHPILLRPTKSGDGFDLVVGERRLRAAKLIGWRVIRARVEEMSDQEALTRKAVENDHRVDVHPLEQADCYWRMREAGMTPAAIAKEVGRTEAHVVQRLSLCDLGKVARRLFEDGGIALKTALRLARIPDAKAREKCATEMRDQAWLREDASADNHIRRGYMCMLAATPFDPASADLVPKAGPCGSCPKRTSAQPALFAEVEISKEDVCLDPACFTAKTEASWKLAAARAEAAGQEVVDSEAARVRIFYPDGRVQSGAAVVALDDRCEDDPKRRTFRKLLGHRVAPKLVKDPRGAGREVVDRAEAAKMLREIGHSFAKERPGLGAAEKRARDAQRRRRDSTRAILEACVRSIEKGVDYKRVFDAVAAHFVSHANGDALKEVAARRGWKAKGNGQRTVLPEVAKLSWQQKAALVAEVVLATAAYWHREPTVAPHVLAAAAALGVDAKDAVERAKERAAKEKPAAEKKRSKKGA